MDMDPTEFKDIVLVESPDTVYHDVEFLLGDPNPTVHHDVELSFIPGNSDGKDG